MLNNVTLCILIYVYVHTCIYVAPAQNQTGSAAAQVDYQDRREGDEEQVTRSQQQNG